MTPTPNAAPPMPPTPPMPSPTPTPEPAPPMPPTPPMPSPTPTPPARPGSRTPPDKPIPPGAPTPLRVEGLVKTYSGRPAVDGLTLAASPGQIVGFLGPNGSGKTTTMRCVLGLAKPDDGKIAVFGQEPGSPEALSQVGALIEEPSLYTHLSGRDHLRLAAAWRGADPARADQLLTLVGLAGAGKKACGKYSLGMKQRLGLATALLGDPPLLVLDEPSNGLDPAGLRDVRRLLERFRAEGRAVLLSSHMLGEVEALADQLVIVRQGRTVYQGPLDGLLETTRQTSLPEAFLAVTEPEDAP
ncbi:MAG: ATP-binding cassette domain-containing protein [Bifidobacteriaceae bacterium]|jgi:ABC-2 type transport system ATP-binding protein|nr:ATP-binding cassette domain-containing protein [Bifidobacteriaceae bacterium]